MASRLLKLRDEADKLVDVVLIDELEAQDGINQGRIGKMSCNFGQIPGDLVGFSVLMLMHRRKALFLFGPVVDAALAALLGLRENLFETVASVVLAHVILDAAFEIPLAHPCLCPVAVDRVALSAQMLDCHGGPSSNLL